MPPRPDEDRREQLLVELESIVLQEGFAQLRVGQLADRLHCSRSTLYKLAPDKQALIALVLDRYVDRAIGDGEAQANQLDAAAERVMCFCEVVDFWRAKGKAAFWRDASHTSYRDDVLLRSYKKGTAILKRYLDEGVASGEFDPTKTDFIAHTLWLVGRGTQDRETLSRLGIDRTDCARELTRLVVAGLRCGAEAG